MTISDTVNNIHIQVVSYINKYTWKYQTTNNVVESLYVKYGTWDVYHVLVCFSIRVVRHRPCLWSNNWSQGHVCSVLTSCSLITDGYFCLMASFYILCHTTAHGLGFLNIVKLIYKEEPSWLKMTTALAIWLSMMINVITIRCSSLIHIWFVNCSWPLKFT